MSKKSNAYLKSEFENKRKNPIELGDDSNLDLDFKPIRIGREISVLQLS